jgi:DNA-binding MarR family transcriptional regulator
MTTPFEELAGLDRLIHEPARLAILTALASCEFADYLFLQRLTGLTGGNLSSHLSKLEAGGLVQLDKHFVEKKPNTQVQITEHGKHAIELHWKQLDDLHESSKTWKKEE